MTKVLIEKKNVRNFIDNFKDRMAEKGYGADKVDDIAAKFFTDKVLLKYTPSEEDLMWEKLLAIARSPGGIKYLMNNMDYMNQFEHRRFRGLKSVNGKQSFIKKGAH